MKISAIVLAAGDSSRFNGNKLLTSFHGMPLIEHTLKKLKQFPFTEVIVVTQYEAIQQLAHQYHFSVILNQFPEKGMNYSIRLGIQALKACDACFFLVADQPYLKSTTINKMLQKVKPDTVVACSISHQLRNPICFPCCCFEQLAHLKQYEKARDVALKYPYIEIETTYEELKDFDTRKDWEENMNQELLKECGIVNLRELGGLEAKEGFKVKKGCFYRSAPITFKDDFQREAFYQLNLHAILDLRSPYEREKNPDELIPHCAYYPISAMDIENNYQGNFDMSELSQQESVEDLMHHIKEMYAQLPFHNEAYQKMFELMKTKQVPFLFHCTAGKDRTGVAAYLILKALGVKDEIILENYLLSNEYRKEENEKLYAYLKSDAIRPLMEVKKEYLEAAMQAIQNKYNSFEEFLKQEYQIDEKDLAFFKENYLEL